MVKVNIPTKIQAPSNINITLVREDFLDISNNYRIFFEVCLTLFSILFGNIFSIINGNKDVPFISWFFLFTMIIGCLVFLFLAHKYYKKAKS